jgi:tripartite-type tricarboxylate transporter receptor subunit TctC
MFRRDALAQPGKRQPAAGRGATMSRIGVFALCASVWLAGLPLAAAAADGFPQRTITFVCPFPAGGGTDILTRMLAQELQERLKRPVIVENRPGAATQVAAAAVAKSPPDGYMLLVAPVTTLAIGPSVFKSLPYDTQKDFAPIGLVGSAQFALVANPSLGANTLPELIALVRSKSGQLSYGSSGAATPHRLFMEMFLKMIGATAQHVPYRGSVPALTDVVSGQIPMMMVDLAVAMPMIREGKVRAYGVTSPDRIKAMPELPTIAEAGLPGYAATGWFSVVARAGTPRPIVDKINRVLIGLPPASGRAGPADHAGDRAADQYAGRARDVHRVRDQEVGPGGPGRGDYAGVNFPACLYAVRRWGNGPAAKQAARSLRRCDGGLASGLRGGGRPSN